MFFLPISAMAFMARPSSIQSGNLSPQCSLGTSPYCVLPDAMPDVWRLNSSEKGSSLRKVQS